MINTVELLKIIQTFLKTKHTRVYFQKVPPKTSFPYISFLLSLSYDNKPSEDFTVDIDFWDINENTTTLEQLVDSVDNSLNNKTIQANGITASFYRETRQSLIDEDERINRRQLTYTVRTYYRGG